MYCLHPHSFFYSEETLREYKDWFMNESTALNRSEKTKCMVFNGKEDINFIREFKDFIDWKVIKFTTNDELRKLVEKEFKDELK